MGVGGGRIELKIMIFSLRQDFSRKYLSNRSEDAKNGFFRKFYIDIVIQKNIFFSHIFEKLKNIFENVKIFKKKI